MDRIAARLDDRFDLVAGAFASTAERSPAARAALGLAADRVHGDLKTMATRAAGLPDGIEAAATVTPNRVHAAATAPFLGNGIQLICDSR